MEFLNNLKNGDIKSIAIVIFAILLFNIYWCKTKEPMADVSDIDIKEAIRKVYLADIEAIRNLSNVSIKLQKEGLTVKGNLNVLGALNVNGSFNQLPKGAIVAWTGVRAPTGWTLCDGNNNTPDLRGKFIFGSSSSKDLNTIGGNETVTLSIDQIPSHQHNVTGTTSKNGDHTHTFGVGGGGGDARNGGRGTTSGYTCGGCSFDTNTDISGNHTHTINVDSGYTGGGKPHEIMPPFHVLTYIMKL